MSGGWETWAGMLLLAWSIALWSISLEALRRLWLRMRKAKTMNTQLPPHHVLLLRPCAGAEPALPLTLRSARSLLAGNAEVRCVFGVESREDAALAPAEDAARTLNECGIPASVVITHACTPNRKAAQLERMLAHGSPMEGIVVVADSDVDLAGLDLQAFLCPLFGPNPALSVWAPPVETGPPLTWGDRASAAWLGASIHSFPLLGGLDPRGLVGKLFALRTETLEKIGGFSSLTHILGEDMEIARRISERGGRIEMAPFPARSLARGRSFSQAVHRFGRWLSMIRTQRPLLLLTYPGLFFATPLLCVASLPMLYITPKLSAGALLLALSSRLLCAWAAAKSAQEGRVHALRLIQDAALADALMLAAFWHALSSRTIVWRRHTFSVGANGVLSEEPTECL